MKMAKSLMLGSVAGIFAMSGAQAADLPVKAKAVEYVKICSLYGAGFYYIPGTDTCIKLGGYLRVETGLWTNSIWGGPYNGPAGAQNRYSNHYTSRAREDFNIDTRTATEYGVLRTFFDATFSWTTGSTTGSATGTVYSGDAVAGGFLGVYYAFIQFAGFTMGKAISQFSTPWTNYPANNFDGLVGGGGDVTGVNQFSYTADLGQGMQVTFSAQDQVQYYQTAIYNTSFPNLIGAGAGTISSTVGSTLASGAYGVNSIGGAWAPDLIAHFRIDQAWGLFQASVAAHDNHASYYIPTLETSGHPGDRWGWAGQLGLSIKNIPTGPGDTINMTAVYTNGASRYNFQDLVPISFVMYGSTSFPGAYQSVGFASVSDAVFSGTSTANGTGLQLTTTYGFRGGYTHNWNPYWNTSIFGAFAAVRYNNTAKTQICSNFPLVTVPGVFASCNPDFNLSQIGLKTGWTPVTNLTFSGEVVYTNLDQKFAGAVAIPNVPAIAKPTALYELKDQNVWTFLVRAQRNW